MYRVVLSMLSREMQRSVPVTKVRRRSEIDRRLDALVPVGRLKDSHTTTIVKVQFVISCNAHNGPGSFSRISEAAAVCWPDGIPLLPFLLSYSFC